VCNYLALCMYINYHCSDYSMKKIAFITTNSTFSCQDEKRELESDYLWDTTGQIRSATDHNKMMRV
jgi:hypothetical protein